MGTKVEVDTEQLRANAQSLHEANAERRRSSPVAGRLGASRSTGAFEQFDGYWHPALATVAESIDALREALGSAADAYERRDAKSADGFAGGAPRAV